MRRALTGNSSGDKSTSCSLSVGGGAAEVVQDKGYEGVLWTQGCLGSKPLRGTCSLCHLGQIFCLLHRVIIKLVYVCKELAYSRCSVKACCCYLFLLF